MNILYGWDLSPVWISLKTAGTATLITIIAGTAAAWWMTCSNIKGKNLIDSLLVLPMVLPPTVIGFILLFVFGRNGPVGNILSGWGIYVVFSWPATVIAAATVAFPIMYKTTRAAFTQVDTNLVDAARTLGASEWQVFRRVIVPLARPGMAAGAVLSFARAMGEFGATLMLAGSIQGKTQTIPMAIFFAVESGETVKAFIWVMLMTTVSLVMMMALNQRTGTKNGYPAQSGGSGYVS